MNNSDWMRSSRFPCTEPPSYLYQQQDASGENLADDEFQRLFGDECKFEYKVMIIAGAKGL